MNCAPVNVSMRVLRETFLSTFQRRHSRSGRAQRDAVLQRDRRRALARQSLAPPGRAAQRVGFPRDFVVSDYFAIRELHERADSFGHHVAHDPKEAAGWRRSRAWTWSFPIRTAIRICMALVRDGTMPESVIDERVRPMLRAKFQTGALRGSVCGSRRSGTPRPRARSPRARARSGAEDDHPAEERRGNPAARFERLETLAVIGPNADRVMLGGYSGVPLRCETVLDGDQIARAGDRRASSTTRAAGSPSAARGPQDEVTPQRSGGKPPHDPRGGGRCGSRPMSSCSRSATTSRRRARVGGSTTWAIAPASISPASRTS